MFSLEQLASFVAVAEELHYGRAAERLRMTQPPLSRRIQTLERELEVELFDRSHRAVRLTPAGRLFLADARRILHLSEEAALSARRGRRGETGIVTVGFTATAAYSLLEHVVSKAAAQLPGVELVLHEMVTSAQTDALLAGTLDVGMVRPPVRGGDLVSERLLQEPLLAALPVSHALASREAEPEVRDFDGSPFIMYSPAEARYFYDVLTALFRSARVQPRYTQYLSQVHTVLAMVKAELGVSLVPASASALRFEGVVLRRIADLDFAPVELDLVWRQGNDNPALRALLRVLRSVAAAYPSRYAAPRGGQTAG